MFRIVSLVPSVTELVCDLGLADQLVGRTGFCIHPWQTVRRIPKVGGTRDVMLERIKQLEPTHVIVNVDENRREDAEALAEFVPNVVVTHPIDPTDNLDLFRQMGGLFGREHAAEALCRAFETALNDLRGREHERQRVLYLIWRDPWMTVSPETYVSRMLELINWHTLPAASSERYPIVDLTQLETPPDRVLLSSEPFHFDGRHVREVAPLLPSSRVSLVDGEMISWYGSRAIVGLRYLADLAA